MYRAQRVGVSFLPHHRSNGHFFCFHNQQRFYTPIWSPGAAVDQLGSLRDADETCTLWATAAPIGDVNAAVEAWMRFGNDPVLHTALPLIYAGKHVRVLTDSGSLSPSSVLPSSVPQSTSPFAHVEDYMGTNMVFGSPEHVKDSAAVWASYFERRYAGQLRHSRRTVANHIGLVNAPEIFTDEADRPETKWSQDTFFCERAYMAERFLKEKVNNLQQFERVLKQTTSGAYLAFHDALQQQTQTLIPLPSPSVWHYEGSRRAQWAERFVPLMQEAQLFFTDILAVDLKKDGNTSENVLQRVAAVFSDVFKILVKRQRRFIDGRQWSELTLKEKNEFCANEVANWQRQVETGEFDSAENVDSTLSGSEWKEEHDEIMRLMSAKIDGLSFTALDFWQHTLRCEELETEHIHCEKRVRSISASARKALYDTTSFEAAAQGVVDSIARGQLDMGAACLRPHFNDVWCQLHYAKFGASTVTQHTTTSRRQLLFFHAASLKEVAATAALYYATKPLSTSLDYASPYKFRRSLLRLFSSYGVDMAHAAQRPLLLSAAHLAQAEDLMRSVVVNVARPFGERRRSAVDRLRANYQRHTISVQNVMVSAVVSEFVQSGKDVSLCEGEKLWNKKKTVTSWPIGGRRVVSYDWPTTHMETLKTTASASPTPLTSQHVMEIENIKQRAFVEVSLWRRVSAEERRQRQEAIEKEALRIEEAVQQVPSLSQVQQYATSLYQRIGEVVPGMVTDGRDVCAKSTEEKDVNNCGESLWEFAVMLDDRAAINVNQADELYLPYTDANGVPLPPGEYRVRVRGFDVDMNPELNPALCSEAFSEPLQVFDALPQLVEQFFGTSSQLPKSDVPHIPASDFISFCAFLRDAELDVPLRCEFEAGQVLTTDGDVFLDHFLTLLRSDKFHQSRAQAALTEVQRAIEPSCRAHWELYHPGANEAEWAEARRGVLNRAMEEEREWWFPNDMLDVKDISTGSTNGLSFSMYPATVRYGVELCTVLTAKGKFDDGNKNSDYSSGGGANNTLSAVCVVNGTGAAESLVFDSGNLDLSALSVDEALSVAKGAIRNAHDRHNTLTAFRLGPLAKQSQVLVFCGIHGLEFGGKYARTYAYAFEKAKKELAATALAGRVVPGVDEDDVERTSEKETVDRFASKTHPEQRKPQFTPRMGPGGVPIDDPTADQKVLWGR